MPGSTLRLRMHFVKRPAFAIGDRHKKTPPLRGGVVIHDGLRKPEPESLFVQLFWTKPILTISAF